MILVKKTSLGEEVFPGIWFVGCECSMLPELKDRLEL